MFDEALTEPCKPMISMLMLSADIIRFERFRKRRIAGGSRAIPLSRLMRRVASILLVTTVPSGAALAASAVSCGGFAMLGGAQINCSHVMPKAPVQVCTFTWSLLTTAGVLQTVQGSFLLPPGASNAMVYQAGGFNSALSNPIILCQGSRGR